MFSSRTRTTTSEIRSIATVVASRPSIAAFLRRFVISLSSRPVPRTRRSFSPISRSVAVPPRRGNLRPSERQLAKKLATEAALIASKKEILPSPGGSSRSSGFSRGRNFAERVFIKSAIRQWRKFSLAFFAERKGDGERHLCAATLTIAGRIELQRKLIRRRAGSCTEGLRDAARRDCCCRPCRTFRRRSRRGEEIPFTAVYRISAVIAPGNPFFTSAARAQLRPGIYRSISDNSRGNNDSRTLRLIPRFPPIRPRYVSLASSRNNVYPHRGSSLNRVAVRSLRFVYFLSARVFYAMQLASRTRGERFRFSGELRSRLSRGE